jgi:NAD(P)-dependent dehydrogenase (short-subunit alcohol dehydrogenase family)
MRAVIVTGSAGLIGSETVKRFAKEGARVVGIDNDMRAQFFGAEASTKKIRDDLITNVRRHATKVSLVRIIDDRKQEAPTNYFQSRQLKGRA